ncbi:hypothetical protein P4O66_012943 [Electrophorus voltai]|uniref:Uncharacterized protein n=1 Tax=Electrophorus voltai TaxID=2609070 RepID=A0AAD9E8L5_9TELE|nr:hypothetical protein P4O66_012943 [Electrophorus voltai]
MGAWTLVRVVLGLAAVCGAAFRAVQGQADGGLQASRFSSQPEGEVQQRVRRRGQDSLRGEPGDCAVVYFKSDANCSMGKCRARREMRGGLPDSALRRQRGNHHSANLGLSVFLPPF